METLQIIKRPKKLEAFIFDLEGTLIETLEAYKMVFENAAENLRIPFKFNKKAFCELVDRGSSEEEILQNLVGKDLALRLMEEIRKISIKVFTQNTRVIDGVDYVFSEIKKRGLQIAIFTNMEYKLGSLKVYVPSVATIEKFVNVEVTRMDVKRKKPAPDGVFECCKRLGVPPEKCVVVGDSSVDIKAGKAAGALTVAVLSGVGNLENLKKEKPDAIIPSIKELVSLLDMDVTEWKKTLK